MKAIINHILKTMTRDEAKLALRQGKKLTHTYFSKDEWVMGGEVTPSDEFYVLEDGVHCTAREFWNYRKNYMFDHGWEIFKEN
jgi:hypothetical protein